MQKLYLFKVLFKFEQVIFHGLLALEYETTALSQNISHQFYIAMAPCPEEQKPELHLRKSLKVAC